MNNDLGQFFQRGPDCPPVEELSASLNLPQTSAQRHILENHISTCSYCHNELELLRAFESGAMRDHEREPVEAITARLASGKLKPRNAAPGYWQRISSPTGISAALALAAALIIAVNLDRGVTRPNRNEGPDTFRSVALRALSPVGALQTLPQEFRWTPFPQASNYSLIVMEVDRTPVLSKKVSGTSVPIPSQIRQLIEKGKILQWNVVAYDKGGRELASTALQRFQLESLK